MSERSNETAREVFLSGCDVLAAALTPLGFTYARSRQRLRRKRGPYVEEVAFQSSHYNVAEAFVAIWPHVLVDRPDLGEWRESHSPLRGNRLAGGQLGNLAGSGWTTWDLADPATRPAVIESVGQQIATVGMSWIDTVESADRLIDEARRQDVAGVDIEMLIDYLAFLNRRPDATEVLEAWLERHRDTGISGFLARLRPVVDRHQIRVSL